MEIDFEKYLTVIKKSKPFTMMGRVKKVVGLTIESSGPEVNIGEICILTDSDGNEKTLAEVVGFKDNNVLLMPFGDISGIGPQSSVISTGNSLKVAVGSELIGRVLDGLGNPIDGKGDFAVEDYYSVENEPPSPLTRKRIREVLPLGIKCIDGFLTVGRGQRLGIFAGSGVGKSTLMGMIAKNALSDVNVISLVGERGREVREFIERDLGEEGLKRSIVIVATSDQPAIIRLKAAFISVSIAEFFRDQGKDVLLLMDSLTRFAMAQREIGLAVGEPPVSRGYTPSVFALMPKLLERMGSSDVGSITGLCTVLVDGDDLNEPVTDTVRGIVDGHIVLSRQIANRNQYPAIDVLASVSRVMPDIVTNEHKSKAASVRQIMAIYKDSEELINIGAYNKGSNEKIDHAIEVIDDILSFIQQGTEENIEFEDIINQLSSIE